MVATGARTEGRPTRPGRLASATRWSACRDGRSVVGEVLVPHALAGALRGGGFTNVLSRTPSRRRHRASGACHVSQTGDDVSDHAESQGGGRRRSTHRRVRSARRCGYLKAGPASDSSSVASPMRPPGPRSRCDADVVEHGQRGCVEHRRQLDEPSRQVLRDPLRVEQAFGPHAHFVISPPFALRHCVLSHLTNVGPNIEQLHDKFRSVPVTIRARLHPFFGRNPVQLPHSPLIPSNHAYYSLNCWRPSLAAISGNSQLRLRADREGADGP